MKFVRHGLSHGKQRKYCFAFFTIKAQRNFIKSAAPYLRFFQGGTGLRKQNENKITSDKAEIVNADRLILPGVGAFGDAMDKLNRSGLVDTIKSEAAKKPFLGICRRKRIRRRSRSPPRMNGQNKHIFLHRFLPAKGTPCCIPAERSELSRT